MEKVEKTDAEWRAELTPEQYHVMRQKGTEPAFSGALYRNHADGTYRCGACGAELTIHQYMQCPFSCPNCREHFNPGCRNHYGDYFALGPSPAI